VAEWFKALGLENQQGVPLPRGVKSAKIIVIIDEFGTFRKIP
jgi:hypothetical protein